MHICAPTTPTTTLTMMTNELLAILFVHSFFMAISYCLILPPGRQDVSLENSNNGTVSLSRPIHSYKDLSAMAFRSLLSSNYEDTHLQSRAVFQQMTGRKRHRKRPQEEHKKKKKKNKMKNKKKKKKNKQKQREKEQQMRLLQQQHVSGGSALDNLKTVYSRKPQTYIVANRDMIGVEHCRTIAFKQRIRVDGCLTKTVVNNICHGQCNSFFIPRLHSNKLRALFESYSVCRPTQVTTVTVHLHCPARPTPLVRRKYFKVKECSCMSAREPPIPSFAGG